ncbi:putative metal-binding membrane protein [Labrenzia sp. EL_126]|nr:putative metal-binding membrane protein [Labrenzia sp. EL_126]
MSITTATTTTGSHDQQRKRPAGAGSWPFVLLLVATLSVSGWAYLIAMIADMVPAMDMAEAGPGMKIFNQFNLFKGLSAETRAALAVLCLPAGATFGMPTQAMTAIDLAKVFVMWAMMSMAMMLPTSIPMLKAYTGWIDSREGSDQRAFWPVFGSTFGYLSVWFGYAVIATVAQWLLSMTGGLNDMMAPASLALTTSVLFAAGIYQFTPAKKSCLQRCWYPRWVFSAGSGKSTILSGYREGLVQGWACLGCCWAVMTVMFAVGLMNIVWIALLGGVMALEKAVPNRVFPAAIGVFLLVWAGFLTVAIYF